MSDLIPAGSKLLSLLHQQRGGLTLPKPFERDIFLLDTHVAGTSHVPQIASLAEVLQPEDLLTLRREPDNEHDELAILVLTAESEKLGYVPRAVNAAFARLMDAGKHVFARLAQWAVHNGWYKIDIKIFLRD